MAMTFRDTKGSRLTNAEADANFRTLVTATENTALIADMEFNASTHYLKITLTNGEELELGPFATP